MIKRAIQGQVLKSLSTFAVVSILGCRQVGKTTLAKMIMRDYGDEALYLDLQLPSDINKLQDAELYLSSHSNTLVIIDEIQQMPSLFPLIRSLVDKDNKKGRFLILGSASPALMKLSAETLAGRIIYYELEPFSISEVGQDNWQRLWIRGGFPLSYLAKEDGDSLKWREAFIKTYLEMDIPQLGLRVSSQQLRRFWMMVSHMHGSLWNASKIASSLGISAPTARYYLDILQESFIVRELQPYYHNVKKRLVRSPRIYIRDTGLLHFLLNIFDFESLHGHPSLGESWEGFVVEQILRQLPERWQAFFYRTSAGAEIDLVLVSTKNQPIAIEMKYSLSPKLQKGFYSAIEDLGCKIAFVVYPGTETYPLQKGIYALPVSKIQDIFEIVQASQLVSLP